MKALLLPDDMTASAHAYAQRQHHLACIVVYKASERMGEVDDN